MPGHKGRELIGGESLDITEIFGADSLYDASGIIRESERNASELFGCDTLYSTEGSSQCIRAMMYLVCLYAKETGEKPRVLAARNCHKTFVSSAALLDFEVEWLYDGNGSYLSCNIDAVELEKHLCVTEKKPTALYLTSPDYLGSVADIEAIAKVCKKYGVLLCVDNAHGAYLRFLEKTRHPIDLGADICCDSSHKTLPVLTGGAYLHISDSAPEIFSKNAKDALSLFGSTSPSYLILQSLDRANEYISNGYSGRLCALAQKLSSLKDRLFARGYSFYGDEPTKLTFEAKKYGYTGDIFAKKLEENGIICEFCDSDYLVLMFTPEISDGELERLEKALLDIPKLPEITQKSPEFTIPERRMSIREATMSPCELLPVDECEGRILARLGISCPPAVPIAVSGEVIDRRMIECFKYYGVQNCAVIAEESRTHTPYGEQFSRLSPNLALQDGYLASTRFD